MHKLKSIIKKLEGQIVSFKRLAARDILLFFHGNPGEDGVIVLWMGMAWRYEKDGSFVIGSKDHPLQAEDTQTEKVFNKEYEAICALTNQLNGAKVLRIDFDIVTNDMSIEFENNQYLKTFIAGTMNEELFVWRYREFSSNLIIHASCNGINVMPPEDRTKRKAEVLPRAVQ